MDYTFLVIDILSLLAIVSQVLLVILVGLLAYEFVGKKDMTKMNQFIGRHGLLLMLTVAVVASSGSLFFSEVALWAPCKDCWLQRIFMYPQVLLLGLAFYKKDSKIAPYILLLCLVGIAISVEHYVEQIEAILDSSIDPNEPCDLSGISCRATYMREYGYITVPMLAMTAFALNIMGSLTMIRSVRKK